MNLHLGSQPKKSKKHHGSATYKTRFNPAWTKESPLFLQTIQGILFRFSCSHAVLNFRQILIHFVDFAVMFVIRRSSVVIMSLHTVSQRATSDQITKIRQITQVPAN